MPGALYYFTFVHLLGVENLNSAPSTNIIMLNRLLGIKNVSLCCAMCVCVCVCVGQKGFDKGRLGVENSIK